MSKKLSLAAAVGLMAALAAGCITDYGGRPGEMTEGEAKLWGKEIAISGFDVYYDGTWSQTVKYNLKTGPPVTIMNYQNDVFASFSRDGLVDRDGDDIQGRGGTLGGKFKNGVEARDFTPGSPCEFFDNITKDFTGGPGASFALCIFGASEEVDKDLALQDAFASIDDLLQQIWAGTLTGAFSVELTSVTLNGTPITLANALPIDVAHNGFRPINAAIDFSSPGGQELLQAILANTVDGEATDIGLGFNGGMGFSLPVFMTAAFNHDALMAALE